MMMMNIIEDKKYESEGRSEQIKIRTPNKRL